MRWALPAVAALLLAGCGGASDGGGARTTTTKSTASTAEAQTMTLTLTSPAFREGESVPRPFTCDGADRSPPLAWSGAPEGTKTFVLICDDPDAPNGDWVHWVVYDLPARTASLAEAIPGDAHLAGGGTHGRNSWGEPGYRGPCPPSGTHRYFFKLYALDGALGLEPGAKKPEVLKAMEGHVLAEGRLMGRYRRG